MRIESSVTSVGWIPSEALKGLMRVPMDIHLGHYDDPPADQIDDFAALVDSDKCRFANRLAAWIDVDEDGTITDAGYSGGGLVGGTTAGIGAASVRIPGIAYPEIREDPLIGDDGVTFVQTAGGRTGAPFPRKMDRPPYVSLTSPTAWSTLKLTIRTDGSSEFEVRGASPFPRHWIYDDGGKLALKSGSIDFADWTHRRHDADTPWGDTDSPALVTEVETPLERELSLQIMRSGPKPKIVDIAAGEVLMREGDMDSEIALILDGVVSINVDGSVVAEAGPGAVLGEHAALEGGRRTATVTALTPVKVALSPPGDLSAADLADLASGHRREDGTE